ncbi:MAG: TrmH family RNA methyltransferase [Alphaproteobacteria bacterium]
MAEARPRGAGQDQARRITSLTNPMVKEIRSLWLGKNRRKTGLFIGEGLKLVVDALAAGWPLRRLVYARRDGLDRRLEAAADACRAAGGAVVEVSEAVLSKIARRDNPQTVIGVFEQRTRPLAEVSPATGETWVALEDVRDPGNLGTIIRTADAAGAAGVLLVGTTVDPFAIETVRATMGSIFHVPLVRASLDDFVATTRTWPGAVVGTHLSATQDYREASYEAPVLLVMGPEQAGLSDTLAAQCSTLVKIPMAGQADSLNLAIATGIMLFEVRRGALKLT